MELSPIDDSDLELIDIAKQTIQNVYKPAHHNVAAAIRTKNGKIYKGVNVDTAGYGPCAEPIALGAAFTEQDSDITSIVALYFDGNTLKIIPPCGNCRQLFVDYIPNVDVILELNGQRGKIKAEKLLPYKYQS